MLIANSPNSFCRLHFPTMPPSKTKRASTANRKKAVSMKEKTGVTFPIPRVQRLLKRDRLNQRIARSSAIVMTAVMEYITSEILELAGSVAVDGHKKRIVPRHISLALMQDDELAKIVSGSIIHEGGARPFIHEALKPKKGKAGATDPSQAL